MENANDHVPGASQQGGGNKSSAHGDEPSTIRLFLEEAGVITSTDPMMTLAETRDYICGRLSR